MTEVVLAVRDLRVYFPIRSRLLHRITGFAHAVEGVSFDLGGSETLGLIGESGCGKTTTARAVVGLAPSRSGTLTFNGSSVALGRERISQNRHSAIQMVFQDPYSSLNPRATVEQIVTEGWQIHRHLAPNGSWQSAVTALLADVGLPSAYAARYPRQLSGGERQRVAIARSLAVRPRVLICDEVVSALDVSVKAQILQLLGRLQVERGASYLFISHDTTAVRAIAHRVLVMYLGHAVEVGATDSVFVRPAHPYTKALLSAAPRLRPWQGQESDSRIVLSGEVPSITNPPSGCPFHTRCWKAEQICTTLRPELAPMSNQPGHSVACHFPEGVGTDAGTRVVGAQGQATGQSDGG
jgi:oligopeptide transport system ATP-binding protein